MNVFDLMMSLSGWQLAARVQGLPFPNLYVVKESDTHFGGFLFPPPSGALPARVFGPTAIPAGTHFPYGLAVDPD